MKTGETKRYIIHDTLEAFIEDLDSGDSYFIGYTTEGNITRTISQEEIKAGIHNKTIAIIQSDDGMEFSVTTGIHYEDIMELQLGSSFERDAEVEIMEIEEDRDGSFTATPKTVTGDIIDLSAENMPKAYKTQLRSIAYDPETMKVVADIYWIFENAQPDGNLNETFGAATNKTQEITFKAKTPIGSDSYGICAFVPREDGSASAKTLSAPKTKTDTSK